MRGVHTATHFDGKLRGFTHMRTIEVCQRSAADEKTTLISSTYQLLCGRGYGGFAVWRVILTEERNICGSPSTYTENWEILHQGKVNGPSMTFGCLRSSVDHDVGKSAIEVYSQTTEKEARIHVFPEGDSAQTRGYMHLKTCSGDGRVMFSGREQLFVHTSVTATEFSAAIFNLVGTSSSLSLPTAGGRSRELSVISSVSCNFDGSRALILCDDKKVFLYR